MQRGKYEGSKDTEKKVHYPRKGKKDTRDLTVHTYHTTSKKGLIYTYYHTTVL